MREPSVSEELFRLVELRNQGVLTDEEFQIEKAKVLKQTTASTTPSSPPPEAAPTSPAPNRMPPPKKEEDKDTRRLSILIGLIMLGLGGAVGLAMVFLNPHKQRDEAMQQQSAASMSMPASAVQSASTATSPPPSTVASAENAQPTAASSANLVTQAQDQQALEAAQLRYDRTDGAINELWQGLDGEVRNQLQNDQNAFNQSKESRCNQLAAESSGNETVRRTIALNCQAEANEGRVSALRDAANAAQPQLLQRRLEQAQTNNAQALNEFESLSSRMPPTVKEQLQGELQTWLSTTRNQCSVPPSGSGDASETAIAGINCFTKALQDKNAELRQYVI
mgnify:FL=1|jgi:cytoskeletal protein RodZ